MPLTQDQIQRLSFLTAIQGDTNIDIDSVLQSFSDLQSTPTDEHQHLSRSGNPVLLLREDTPRSSPDLPDMLLACSPQKVTAHQIVLSGIMQGE